MEINELKQIDKTVKGWLHESRDNVLRKIDTRLEVDTKTSRRDLVTNIDKQNEKFLVGKIREFDSNAKILGEEGFGDQVHSTEGQIWIVDPIDGTMNFVHGFHHSCISVAYAERGVVRAGAIYNPYVDEMFTAIAGQGARLNGRPIHAAEAGLSESLVCFGSSPYAPELADRTFALTKALFLAGLDVRREASAALDLCSVAAGRAGLYFELQLSLWDYAAGVLIAEEAGGQCCTIDGGCFPSDGSKTSLLAGSPAAVTDFFRLMK